MYTRKFQITVKKSAPSFDLPFGTVMTKLKLFHVVERKIYHARQTLPFVNSTKSLIFDLKKILLPKRLVLTYSLIAKVMHNQILFAELKSSHNFLSYVQFYLGSHFPSCALATHLSGKMNHLKHC